MAKQGIAERFLWQVQLVNGELELNSKLNKTENNLIECRVQLLYADHADPWDERLMIIRKLWIITYEQVASTCKSRARNKLTMQFGVGRLKMHS